MDKDIVFLMNTTGSMGNCINKFKANISSFFGDQPRVGTGVRVGLPIMDWRAKVVGFRDVETNGTNWFEDNLFTRDIREVERQFHALTVGGDGGDRMPLLDAIYKVADAPKSEKGEESPSAWRHRSDAKRVVIAFTDAPYNPIMTAPGIVGGDFLALRNICVGERIVLAIVAPKGVDDDGFEYIVGIRYATWIPVPAGYFGEKSSFEDFADVRNAFLRVLAKFDIAKS